MPRFKLKDGTFEAVRWDGQWSTAQEWIGEKKSWRWVNGGEGDIEIPEWYGWAKVEVGDYLVFGPGVLTVLPCETFEKLFKATE